MIIQIQVQINVPYRFLLNYYKFQHDIPINVEMQKTKKVSISCRQGKNRIKVQAYFEKQALCWLACAKTYKNERDKEHSVFLTLVIFCASKQAKCLLIEGCPITERSLVEP